MTKIYESEKGTMRYEVPKDKLKLERQISALEIAVKNDEMNNDNESLQFHEPALKAAREALAQF